MSLNFCLDAVDCELVCLNLYTNFFLHSKFMHEFLKFHVQIFSFVFVNSYVDLYVNFVHEIHMKFIIFGKLRKCSYEFAQIYKGYVTNGLYCTVFQMI